jgi:hypothetical protein
MMHYGTIVTELLQDQYPSLHSCLEERRALSQATNEYASYLECHHESWIDRLSDTKPDSDLNQIANDTLSLAIEDLGQDICSADVMLNGRPGEPLGLYAAMGFLRRAARSEVK